MIVWKLILTELNHFLYTFRSHINCNTAFTKNLTAFRIDKMRKMW